MLELSQFAFFAPSYGWRTITYLGAAGLVLPVTAAQLLGFWPAQKTMAVRWALGIARLYFTGISGHALLAT